MLVLGITGASPELRGFLAGNIAILAALGDSVTSVVFDAAVPAQQRALPTPSPERLVWNIASARARIAIETFAIEDPGAMSHCSAVVICGGPEELDAMFHVEHPSPVVRVLCCESHEDFESVILQRMKLGLSQLLPYALVGVSLKSSFPVLSDPLGQVSRALLELHQELLHHE